MDKNVKDFFFSVCDKLISNCDEIIENLKEQETKNSFTVFQSPNEIKEALEKLSQPKEDTQRGCRDKMDEECIDLVAKLNSLKNVQTTESCCGHLTEPYRIWFRCNNFVRLAKLYRCVNKNYSDGKWCIEVDGSDVQPTYEFLLRSKEPFKSYSEMEKSIEELIDNIDYWEDEKYDEYFQTSINEDCPEKDNESLCGPRGRSGTNLLIKVSVNEMSMFGKPRVTYNLSDGVFTVTTEINIGNRCIKETTTHNISSEFDTNNFSVFEENGIINIVFYKK